MIKLIALYLKFIHTLDKKEKTRKRQISIKKIIQTFNVGVFTANFKPKHVILSFITYFCYRLNRRALHKPYVLIKQHIKRF